MEPKPVKRQKQAAQRGHTWGPGRPKDLSPGETIHAGGAQGHWAPATQKLWCDGWVPLPGCEPQKRNQAAET